MAFKIKGYFSHITSHSEVGDCWLRFPWLFPHVHGLKMAAEALVIALTSKGRKQGETMSVKSVFLFLSSNNHPQQTQTYISLEHCIVTLACKGAYKNKYLSNFFI